jgi:hypothetical protein
MSEKRKCLTPGAVYETEIHLGSVSVRVSLPDTHMIVGDAKELEHRLHDAVEAVVAEYMKRYICFYCGHDEPPRFGLYEGQD